METRRVALLMRDVRVSRVRTASTRRAPWTRSGRTDTMLATTRNVITASPMPMSTCTPTIAVSRVSSGIGTAPPTA